MVQAKLAKPTLEHNDSGSCVGPSRTWVALLEVYAALVCSLSSLHCFDVFLPFFGYLGIWSPEINQRVECLSSFCYCCDMYIITIKEEKPWSGRKKVEVLVIGCSVCVWWPWGQWNFPYGFPPRALLVTDIWWVTLSMNHKSLFAFWVVILFLLSLHLHATFFVYISALDKICSSWLINVETLCPCRVGHLDWPSRHIYGENKRGYACLPSFPR